VKCPLFGLQGESDLPLRGLHVIEIGVIVSGPTAGLILADLGADVTKIENIEGGDPNRENTGAPGTGQFDFLNRNKRSIAINLKTVLGREVFLRLAKECDVIIENLGPGTAASLGVDYSDVIKVNPSVIYCSIKGFGEGVYSQRKMTDYPAQAESGLAYMTGLRDRPMRAGASVLDMMAANMAVIAILSSLLRSSLKGMRRGEKIVVGLFETGAFLMGPIISKYHQNHEIPQPLNEVPFRWAIYDFFKMSNGKKVFIGIINDKQWNLFCHTFGLESLRDDPRFATNSARLQNKQVLVEKIQEELLKLRPEETLRLLEKADIPYAILNRPDELIHHPQLEHKMLSYVSCYNSKKIKLPALPIESSAFRYVVRNPAPKLGEYTKERLLQLGYTIDEIIDLRRKGVISY